jgi:hypothetical protein
MAAKIRLWSIQRDNRLREFKNAKLNLEERLETWIEHDIAILADNLLIIGRQIVTDFGGIIDLLCLDQKGDIVIVELKRGKTPREITAQALDYASWVKDLSQDKVRTIANTYLKSRNNTSLQEAFREKFGADIPEILNESHSMVIIASQIDPSSERIIKYLSETHGVNINAVTFQYFKDDIDTEYLARTFLLEPSQVIYQAQTHGASKRLPNLSLEELQQIADEQRVGDLYKWLAQRLEKYLSKSTTRSSLTFYGTTGGSRKAIFSLLPPESTSEAGLRFQVYFLRFTTYFHLDGTAALACLPEHREEWKYYPSADEDMVGYAGFFRNKSEAEHFIAGIGVQK